ncbi:MAG: tRNA-dihydrouridine synthase [Candidatus Desulfovibrio kirbyi]|uniref:tRNA-dihydrouridine synthase n=1 Tax=Candidatus Desulfovibrio kirbyi TaxID=2696086 RepID=A0A6L2R465_9BACT|nr:MAG: tRNA-dihydrouridine synthase [Candidatus Desulfovibrio kirbyi]
MDAKTGAFYNHKNGVLVEKLPTGRDKPWLAPLAGYSDLPFRLLCREYGAAVCETEMISAKGLVYAGRATRDLLATDVLDQPLVAQLFGAEPEFLRKAVDLLLKAGFIWFDLNMGCSVRKVMRQGAGAALLADHDKAIAAAMALLSAAGRGRVGVKLRLGVQGEQALTPALCELALRLEDMGAGWLTLHPRTARQGFGGQADWDALAGLSVRLSLPLLASGDLLKAEDGLRCLDYTGASGVMYARGAMRDPTIFSAHRALCRNMCPQQPDADILYAVILRHVALARAFSPDMRALRKMRSVIPLYARSLSGVRVLRDAVCRSATWRELEDVLAAFFLTGKS